MFHRGVHVRSLANVRPCQRTIVPTALEFTSRCWSEPKPLTQRQAGHGFASSVCMPPKRKSCLSESDSDCCDSDDAQSLGHSTAMTTPAKRGSAVNPMGSPPAAPSVRSNVSTARPQRKKAKHAGATSSGGRKPKVILCDPSGAPITLVDKAWGCDKKKAIRTRIECIYIECTHISKLSHSIRGDQAYATACLVGVAHV